MRDVQASNGPQPQADIAVIGAGIVGVACALQLARQGLRVQVVDQQAPGQGASFGNAGHLATEQVFPIADLSILRRLPAMLMDPMGPLRLDWKYLPHALPWFVRLLLNLRPAPFRRTVAGIRALNEGSLEAWRRGMSVNVDSVFLGCKHALPLMRERQPGSIVNISSVSALIASHNMANYNASKAAVWMLTKSVALHCARQGWDIRCNSIHPTFVRTPMLNDIVPGDEEEFVPLPE